MALLDQEPVDITPLNKAKHVWSESESIDKFASEWSMKPVAIRGIFDHNKEIKVEKMRNGEKGFDIVTPFYSHLDTSGKEQGILVNRGWVPSDLKDQRLHYMTDTMGTVRGVLYRGDALTKYSKPNSPVIGDYYTVRPLDFSLLTQLPNQEEASQVMLHMVDFDEDRRQVLPTVPTKRELTQWVISPERHGAYEFLWRGLTFAGIAANSFIWLYL